MNSHLTDDLAQRVADAALEADPSLRDCCEQHLACCAGCASLVESYRELAVALRALPCCDPPPDFTEGVMTLVAAREDEAAWSRRAAAAILGSALALAALALAVAGSAGWAPVLQEAGAGLVGVLHGLSVTAEVVFPLVRALRLELALVSLAAALPVLLALSRLVPWRPGAAGA